MFKRKTRDFYISHVKMIADYKHKLKKPQCTGHWGLKKESAVEIFRLLKQKLMYQASTDTNLRLLRPVLNVTTPSLVAKRV